MPHKQHHDLHPGSQYRAAGKGLFNRSSSAVWEIEKVVADKDGIEYARLVRTDNPSEHKLIARDALLDRALFERL